VRELPSVNLGPFYELIVHDIKDDEHPIEATDFEVPYMGRVGGWVHHIPYQEIKVYF
jgi:hypothetical protein